MNTIIRTSKTIAKNFLVALVAFGFAVMPFAPGLAPVQTAEANEDQRIEDSLEDEDAKDSDQEKDDLDSEENIEKTDEDDGDKKEKESEDSENDGDGDSDPDADSGQDNDSEDKDDEDNEKDEEQGDNSGEQKDKKDDLDESSDEKDDGDDKTKKDPDQGVNQKTLGVNIDLLSEEYEFPSTNEENKEEGAPHVNLISADADEIVLEFVNDKNYSACFEYREDGVGTTESTPEGFPLDERYTPYTCLTDDTETKAFTPNEYVEVRSAFDAERDHDFDWTRFDLKDGEHIEVTEDTSDGYGQEGWLFNRDQGTKTPFEFNEDAASIGNGSLNIEPIQNNYSGIECNKGPGCDKFIGEYFTGNMLVEDLDSVTYDFQIDGDGVSGDANHFYVNVHANSPDNEGGYGECKFDYVPGSGTPGSFTTFSFNSTDTPERVRGGGCPATLAEMEEGSTIFFFSLNVGDTSDNDQGLAGYYDNVVVNTSDKVTTFDFEAPESDAPEMSNLTMFVERDGVYEESQVVKPGDNVRVEVDATDAESDIEDVEFRIQAQDGQYVAPRTYVATTTEGDTYRFEYQVPTDGKYINTHNSMNEDVEGHRFWARATDEVGNYHHGVSGDFTFDITKPTAITTAPESNEVVGGDVEFKAELTDNAKLADYEVIVHYKEGGVNQRVTGPREWLEIDNPGTENTITHEWDSTEHEDGLYHVRIFARDEAGNTATHHETEDRYFVVDNTDPQTTITNLSDGDIVGSDFTIEGDASDENGIDRVVIYVNRYGEEGDYAGRIVDGEEADYNSGTGNFTYSVEDAPEGDYTVKAQSFDNAGNDQHASDKDIQVDATAPNVDDVVLNGENVDNNHIRVENCEDVEQSYPISGEIDLAATIDDNLTGVASARYKIRKVTAGGCSQSQIFNSNWTNLYENDDTWAANAGTEFDTNDIEEDGLYTIQLQTMDGAGNLATKYIDITVDNTEAPTTTIIAPTGTVGSTFTVSGNASADPDVGLNRVYVQLVNRGNNNRYGGTTVHLIGEGEDAEWSVDYDTDADDLPDGTYAAHVSVTDRDGNTGSAGWTDNFTIDTSDSEVENGIGNSEGDNDEMDDIDPPAFTTTFTGGPAAAPRGADDQDRPSPEATEQQSDEDGSVLGVQDSGDIDELSDDELMSLLEILTEQVRALASSYSEMSSEEKLEAKDQISEILDSIHNIVAMLDGQVKTPDLLPGK